MWSDGDPIEPIADDSWGDQRRL